LTETHRGSIVSPTVVGKYEAPVVRLPPTVQPCDVAIYYGGKGKRGLAQEMAVVTAAVRSGGMEGRSK
jgi:hypothetical protein